MEDVRAAQPAGVHRDGFSQVGGVAHEAVGLGRAGQPVDPGKAGQQVRAAAGAEERIDIDLPAALPRHREGQAGPVGQGKAQRIVARAPLDQRHPLLPVDIVHPRRARDDLCRIMGPDGQGIGGGHRPGAVLHKADVMVSGALAGEDRGLCIRHVACVEHAVLEGLVEHDPSLVAGIADLAQPCAVYVEGVEPPLFEGHAKEIPVAGDLDGARHRRAQDRPAVGKAPCAEIVCHIRP